MDDFQGRVRIKDIAEQAGVSVGTVDRVLHGRPNVSEKSRIKVEEVLKKIDYKPNMYASALASNKRYKFLCLLPKHKPGEYWSQVESGLHKAQQQYSDFNIQMDIFYYDPFHPETFVEQSQLLLKNEPDGVVINPTIMEITAPFTDLLHEQDIPFVFVDSDLPQLHPLAFYAQHSQKSGYFAARILKMLAPNCELGLFRQTFQGHVVRTNQQREREAGFFHYMEEHHPETKIHILELPAKNFGRQLEQMDSFFEAHPNMHAGICFNSKVFGVAEYLEKRQITDFRLLGYDHLERNTEMMRNGWVDFLVAQHPWKQGYGCILILTHYVILKKQVKHQNYVPIELISAENVDFYNSTY